jgi:hypothetical protein
MDLLSGPAGTGKEKLMLTRLGQVYSDAEVPRDCGLRVSWEAKEEALDESSPTPKFVRARLFCIL